MARLTDEERQEIRRLFARLADIQADATIAKLEAKQAENQRLQIDIPGDPWEHFGGGHE